MSFYFPKPNIFLLFIYIYLFQVSSEDEQKQLERIQNAINLIISRTNGIIDKISLIFEYEKYNISFKNLRILKPLNKDTKIIKEINNYNELFFNLKNLSVSIRCDVFAKIFSQKKEDIKYKTIFFELYFNEMKFKLINNFRIELSTSSIETIKYNNLDNFEYFSDFNNKKVCIFYEDEKEPILLEDMDSKLKEIFQNKFEEKIKEKQNKFNVFTYDLIQIFDNYHYNITTSEYNYITFLEPKKIKVEENDINLDLEKNLISLKYFTLKGIYEYQLIPGKYYNFKLDCIRDKEHFKYERNENITKLEFIVSDCSVTDDNREFETYSSEYYNEIKDIIQKYYSNYLKEISENYYKNIFD